MMQSSEPRASTLAFIFGASAFATTMLLTVGHWFVGSASTQRNAVPVVAVAKPAPGSVFHVDSKHSRRQAGALLLSTVGAAMNAGPAAATQMISTVATDADIVPIWLGSGCFWGRQYDFVQLEKDLFKRDDTRVTALSGYAGGTKAGPGELNCYFGGPAGTLYEENGQAEVVQVMLDQTDLESQFRATMRTYFKQFRRLPTGQMIRQDPQDVGPAYRSVLGLPGGIDSPLMDVVRQENVNKMRLLEGVGNEKDALNVVWVMDSNKFPFYRAEKYHQFHRGLGRETFGLDYLRDLRDVQDNLGRISPTGCPEFY